MYQEAKIAEIREQIKQFEEKFLKSAPTDDEFEKYLELIGKDAFYSSDAGKKSLEIDEAMERLDETLDNLREEVARTEKRVNAFSVITEELPKLMKK